MKAQIKPLLKILSTKRPHGGEGVQVIVDAFLGNAEVFTNKSGEAMAYLVITDETSKTLFSAHLDTVHFLDSVDGPNAIVYDKNINIIYKDAADPDKDCLGADDGAGVWLLLEMIRAKVPGAYLFHTGEECGGIGSSWMAENAEIFLSGYDRAIAFDRKGSQDVITHQGGTRCCSDKFALDLSFKLGLTHRPDNTGRFTDTANYTEVIPECTNVSCGYESCHTANEMLDVEYLLDLRKACLKLDWESLPVVRNPAESASLWGRTPMRRLGNIAMVFTIVERETEGDYALYNEDDDFIAKHSSDEFLEGYATAMADMEEREVTVFYETEVERRLRAYGYGIEDLDDSNPYDSGLGLSFTSRAL